MSIKKLFVGLAVVALALGIAVSASAQTTSTMTAEQLSAMIAQLQAQIAALTGGTTGTTAPVSATFTRDLTVGSTGADVRELQLWLNAKAGASLPGSTYFGALTKAALAKYQASVGITPASGYFGPKTRAHVASLEVVVPPVTPGTTLPAGCTSTAGYSSTTGAKCDGTTGTPAATITTPGVPGTLTASIRSTPANGTDVKKGEDLAVVAYKLEADDSDMQVSSIALNFNARLWLYADAITVLDGSTVVASKTGLSAADFSEVTSGSDYRIRLNTNLIVPKNGEKILTVKIKMLSFTDRSAATITVLNAQFRAVDGTGVTTTTDVTDDRTFDFVASNTANIVVNLDSSSPLKRIVTTSTTGETDNVVLAVYSLKSENKASTLKTFTVSLLKSTASALTSIFSDVRLEVGDKVFSADSIAASSTFSNLDIALPQDQRVALKIVAKVADADNFTDGTSASTTIVANTTTVVAEDSAYDTATVTSAQVTSEDTVLLKSGVNVSNVSVGALTKVDAGTSAATAYTTHFGFTLTNNSNSDIYVSKAPGVALATSTTGSNASSTVTIYDPVPAAASGDTTQSYIIRANGGSRSFSLLGVVKANGTTSSQNLKITKIYFGTVGTTDGPQGTASTNASNNIDFGLEGLSATATF